MVVDPSLEMWRIVEDYGGAYLLEMVHLLFKWKPNDRERISYECGASPFKTTPNHSLNFLSKLSLHSHNWKVAIFQRYAPLGFSFPLKAGHFSIICLEKVEPLLFFFVILVNYFV